MVDASVMGLANGRAVARADVCLLIGKRDYKTVFDSYRKIWVDLLHNAGLFSG
jgi:hypothetical protein